MNNNLYGIEILQYSPDERESYIYEYLDFEMNLQDALKNLRRLEEFFYVRDQLPAFFTEDFDSLLWKRDELNKKQSKLDEKFFNFYEKVLKNYDWFISSIILEEMRTLKLFINNQPITVKFNNLNLESILDSKKYICSIHSLDEPSKKLKDDIKRISNLYIKTCGKIHAIENRKPENILKLKENKQKNLARLFLNGEFSKEDLIKKLQEE